MTYRLVAAVAAAGLLLSGCASIVRGSSQSILVTTPPTTGASCILASKEGNWTVTSPGAVTVSKSKENITITCKKDGFQDSVASIPSNFEGWTVGNILFGGIIGIGVDAATGAINDYPDAFQVPMTPIPGVTPALAPTAQNTQPNS
jgi:hypothetical protein